LADETPHQIMIGLLRALLISINLKDDVGEANYLYLPWLEPEQAF